LQIIQIFYGRKHVLKQWHDKFNRVLMSDGFSSIRVNKCVYIKVINKECVIISLCVDDMLIFSTNLKVVNSTKLFLTSNVDMKGMNETKTILSIRVIRRGDGIMLSQEHYIDKLLKKFDTYDVIFISTPYDTNSQLKKNRTHPMT
jgi:hypothetical protein